MKKKSKSAKGVSLVLVIGLWKQFNKEVFDNALSVPVIRITRSRKYHGMCVRRESDNGAKLTILVSGPLNRKPADLRDTLLHEMIHQWQYEKGLKYNEHDETFTQWLQKIKEVTGITLQDTWSDCDGDVG